MARNHTVEVKVKEDAAAVIAAVFEDELGDVIPRSCEMRICTQFVDFRESIVIINGNYTLAEHIDTIIAKVHSICEDYVSSYSVEHKVGSEFNVSRETTEDFVEINDPIR